MNGSKEISAQRIQGYDLARAVAVMVMMIVNFECAIVDETGGSGWLTALVTSLEGRAVPVFINLAGIGLSLMAKKIISDDPLNGTRNFRQIIIRRAAFLFVSGMMLRTVWAADILHYYGIYLLIGAYLTGKSSRSLIILIILALIISVIQMVGFEVYENYDWDEFSFPDLETPGEMFQHLFLLGYYSVFPWIALFLLGIILGRCDLSAWFTRLSMSVSGLLMVLVSEWLSVRLRDGVIDFAYENDMVSLLYLAEIEPWPATPLYIISAAGTSMFIIPLCITVQKAFPHSPPVKRLVRFGRFSLTLYVAHILFGIQSLRIMGYGEHQTLVFALACAVLGIWASFLFSGYWQRRFNRGPLEWVMRRISTPLIHKEPKYTGGQIRHGFIGILKKIGKI